MDTFGEWLLQQRNLRLLMVEKFANRVGFSFSTLRKIVNIANSIFCDVDVLLLTIHSFDFVINCLSI